uniref:Uncharacterized protein n=1 Tax=Micrurus paraensis TaxID=1970185 RepID=A0A2D4KEW2_9SAUR
MKSIMQGTFNLWNYRTNNSHESINFQLKSFLKLFQALTRIPFNVTNSMTQEDELHISISKYKNKVAYSAGIAVFCFVKLSLHVSAIVVGRRGRENIFKNSEKCNVKDSCQ